MARFHWSGNIVVRQRPIDRLSEFVGSQERVNRKWRQPIEVPLAAHAACHWTPRICCIRLMISAIERQPLAQRLLDQSAAGACSGAGDELGLGGSRGGRRHPAVACTISSTTLNTSGSARIDCTREIQAEFTPNRPANCTSDGQQPAGVPRPTPAAEPGCGYRRATQAPLLQRCPDRRWQLVCVDEWVMMLLRERLGLGNEKSSRPRSKDRGRALGIPDWLQFRLGGYLVLRADP